MVVSENQKLNEQTEKVTKHEEAIPVVQDYETIVRSKKEGVLNVAFRQGKIINKFKDSGRFGKMI